VLQIGKQETGKAKDLSATLHMSQLHVQDSSVTPDHTSRETGRDFTHHRLLAPFKRRDRVITTKANYFST
jgi:hypothetical protein